MNEEDILFLEESGYTVNEIGAITTKDGTYVSEFANEERSVKSLVSLDDYNHFNDGEKEVEATGFEYDDTSIYSESDQKAQVVAKNKIGSYVTDPSYANLLELPEGGVDDPNYKVAFGEIMEGRKNSGQDYYDSLEAFQEGVTSNKTEEIEQSEVLSEFDNEVDRDDYVKVKERLAQISKEDVDIKTAGTHYREQDDFTFSPLTGGAISNPGEEANIIEKGIYNISKFWTGAAANLMGGIAGDGTGMDNKELKKEYKELKDREVELLTPIATKKKEETDLLIKQIGEKASEYGIWSDEYAMYARMSQQLGKESMKLNDYINGNDFDWSVFSTKSIMDLSSMGFVDVHEQLTIDLDISKKLENDVELTAVEKEYLYAQEHLQKIQNSGFEQSFWHEATGGTVDSVGFLVGGWQGRIAGKAVSRGITTALPKMATPLVKTLAVSGNLAAQTTLHSGTYNSALDKYVGDVEIVEGVDGEPVFLARHDLYNSLKEENRLKLGEIEIAIEKYSEDTARVAELKKMKESVMKYDASIEMPFSGGKSLLYGGAETLKEVASEQFGSAILGKMVAVPGRAAKFMGNKTGVKWQNTKLGKRLVDTKLSARFKDLKSNSNTLNDLNRATTTVPGTQLIGSQAGEMFEEVLVQVMPTVGSDWDGYVDQLSELTKADFYMKIAAQTFLMRSGSKVIDKSTQRYNMYKGLSSEDKAEVKRARADLQVTFDEIAKRGGTQEEFNRAFMSIGEGKFSITDYNNSIKGLEEEGNFEEVASQEEQKRAFAHKQIQSVQAKGKLKEFKKSLQKAKYNKNLDPETKAHIESLLVEVNDIQGDDATYVNSTQVIDLRSKKKFTDKTIEKVEAAKLNKKIDEGEALEEINKHLNTEGKSVDEIFKGDLKYSLGNIGKMSKNTQEYLELSQQKYALTENSNKLQKELDRITDFKHQNNLMNEQDYKAYLSKVGTEVFKGKLTSTQFKKYIAEKPRKVDVRRLGKEKLDKINNDIIVSMTKNEAMQRELSQIKKAMSKQDTKQEPVEVVETNAPVEQVNTNVEAPLASTEKERLEHTLAVQDNLFGALEGTAELVSNLPEQQNQALERESTTVERENTLTAEEQKNISEINEGLNFNEELDLSPTGDLVNEKLTQNMKGYFDSKTQWEGVSPTFKDFWVEAISEGMIKKNDLNKAHMQVLAANWEAAGNGDSKWESIWKENYVKPNSFLSNIFEENDTEIKTEQVVEKEVRDNSDASVEKAEVKIGINPSTGEVQNATPVHGKTAVTQVKANFKAIEYENQRGEVVEIDGKPMVLVSKEDVNKDKIPTLNESKTLNVKATLRTNPGDTWSAEVVGENNWDITVEVVNPNTWKSSFMPFSEWVKQNQKGRTLEEFKQSEEYLNKVPMLYRDKAGEAVAFVADADWHNALTVKDTSKKEGEYVDLNNPSVAHLTTIKEAKDNTITLRKEIANGSVSSVVVESRNGSPWTFIPSSEPSISLEKMSPTSEIVFFKAGTFYGLNNERLDKKVNILNPEIAKELNKKGKSAGTNSAYYLSPVSTENGVTSYEAIPVLRKNENNEAQAFTEDVETAKYILGAQRVLKYADANIKELGITKAEAEALQATIKSKTGLNIKDYDSAKEIVHSLITLQVGNKKYTVGAKNVPVRQHDGKKWVVTETSFSNALFKGQAKALQNTNLDHRTAKGVIVKKNSEGAFEVEVTETYQDFLRKRLSTTVMSYNIGTEGKPQHTHSVQPIITLNSIAGVVAPVSPQVQEKTEPEVEIAKQSLTEQESVNVENAKQILRELNALNEGPIGEAFLGDLENIENTAEALKLVSTFNSKQQRELEQYMFSIITSNHEQAIGLNNLEFKNLIVKEYLNHFNTKKSALQSNYNNIKQIVDSGKEVEGVEALLKNLVDTLENIDNILENSDEIYSKKLTEANRRGFIETNIKSSRELDRKLDEEIEQAEQNGYVDNFFKGSNETVHKDKIGNRLKRIFSEIGTGESGFMGVELFENYDKMYNQTATFLSNPLPLAPSFDAMIEKMETVEKSLPWMASLVKNLKDAPEDVKDGFASNMYKYAANAKFVAFTKGTTGLEGEVWFSNANNLKQKIKDSWVNNFKRGDTTTGDLLNKEALGSLANQYDSWGENPWNQSDKVLRDWLSGFGIVLTDGSWQELKDGNLTITNVNRADEVLSFEDLFYDEGKRKDRLFSNLANYAKQKTKLKTDLNYSENPLLLPFEDMGSILKGLIEIESHYNASLSNITRRDGGKTVSEIVFPSYFLDTYNKLVKSAKGDKTYLKELQNTAFAENSYWLDLLVNEPAMAEVFNFGETGLMSMRNIEGEVNPFAKVEDLSPLDYIYHQRAMFQDMKTEKFPKYKGWKMRVATMSTPTNSDKGRMMLMKTPVFDLLGSEDTLISNEEGTIDFGEELKDLLYDQLVMPELNRINKHKEIHLKGYNKGAVRFNSMPGLNFLEVEGVKAVKFLEEGGIVEEFTEKYKEAAVSYIKLLVEADVQENLNTMGHMQKETDEFNTKDYINRNTGTVQQKKKIAEYDYVINSYFNNSNIMQAIAGDPAMYYKADGNPLSESVQEQEQISRDLGVNLGKRLALMIAPGITGANSHNQNYIQLFLKDKNEVAQNAEYIVGLHYGKDVLKEKYNDITYEQHIKDLRSGNISKTNLAQLNLKFSKVADFFDIETTDAQEYTTLREHLRMLVGGSKITQEKADIIYNTVYVDKKPLDRADSDIQMVLQPMKPVYTGSTIQDGVNRVMYIKSSSLPLIPDLVAGTELEPLMNKMNEIEDRTSGEKTVRASYQSANKVGAMDNPIDPFNQEDLDELTTGYDEKTKQPLRSLTLNGLDLKIQQDIPFKSAITGEDKVSMGTQIFKLLFGDGVADINTKDFNGKELQREFFDAFSTMINLSKSGILDKLGLDSNYQPIESEAQSVEKLQELLTSEAEERGFSENDIKALETQEKILPNGDSVFHFKLPLWFSGNSNKFESMLNAIVNNKIFKQKLPGNAFVVGSETGMKLSETGKAKDNNVVYIGDYKGGELKGTEVLAPSKIKLQGKLIDLFEKDKGGNYKYIKKLEGGGFTINENKIDSFLLENFTFRTPTSSHGSGSAIKIVGFIPSIMGDLMITPKNFIAQMGQDFDIDKLTTYQYYHAKDKDGKVARISEWNKEQALIQYRKALEDLKSKGSLTKKERGDIIAGIDALLSDTTGLGGGISNDFFLDILELEEFDIEEQMRKVAENFDMKLAKNKFIEIHNKVYNSTNSEVQRKINKVLSMEVAEKQAEGIDEINTQNSTTGVNLYSPNYQMNKLISGSTGNTAIGIYAKGVTFNSLVQQSDVPLNLIKQGKKGKSISKEVRIGNIVSKGTFGLTTTISKTTANEVEKQLARTVTEAMDEKVNTATDNEKAQILGRVGITHIDSVAVDNLLSLLGVDLEINTISEKEYDPNNKFHKKAIIDGEPVWYSQYSIPYLLHSQPIIKEYFRQLKDSKSIINEFDVEAEDKIIKSLIGDYKTTTKTYEAAQSKMTGEHLVGNIKSGILNDDVQREILLLYTDLIKDAKKVKELNQIVDLSNLGKSMWELKDKIEKLQDLQNPDGTFNEMFDNPLSLLGAMEQGNFVAKTNQGVMVSNALELGRNLFFEKGANLYPYYDEYLEEVVTGIVKNSNFSGKEIDFKETIFQEIKKYITTNPKDNIFTTNPTLARNEIFFSRDGKESLSRYIAKIFNTEDSNPLVKQNVLLSALSYTVGNNGKPDIIKFDNTEGANVTEEDFYIAFKELLVNDIALPDRNGKPYTTKKMAQELIAYSHLSGGIVSGAIEFHKFIPIEYYEDLRVDAKTKSGKTVNVSTLKMLQRYDTKINNWRTSGVLDTFEVQFFQNNPGKAVQFDKKFSNKHLAFESNSMSINVAIEGGFPKYVSNRKAGSKKLKSDKWDLYELVNNSGIYKKIPVVGDFGLAEYDYGNTEVVSSITTPETINVAPPLVEASPMVIANPILDNKEFTITENDTVLDVLERISKTSFPYNANLSVLAQSMSTLFKDKVISTKIVIIDDASSPIGGSFGNGELTINLALDNVAEVFLHEFVHSVTSDYVNEFVNPNGTLKPNAPKDVVELNEVFEAYRKNIAEKYPKENAEFLKKWSTYKANRLLTKDKRKAVSFTDKEKSVFYAALNLKEFLSIPLSNNKEFLEETSKMKYKNTSISIGKKFAKVFQRIINTIAGKENKVGQELVQSTLDFVSKRAETMRPIPQAVSDAELESLKQYYLEDGPEWTGDYLPNNNPISISERKLKGTVDVANILKQEGANIDGNVATFDKGSYLENYTAMVSAKQEIKNWNRTNYNVNYADAWTKHRRVGDTIEVAFKFPSKLEQDLIENRGVLPVSNTDIYTDLDYFPQGLAYNFPQYISDKQSVKRNIDQRIGVLQEVHNKTVDQLNQIKELQKISKVLKSDIDALQESEVDIIDVFEMFTKDLNTIKNKFLDNPILENLMLGREYLERMKSIVSKDGDNRFSEVYFNDIQDKEIRELFQDFQKYYSEVNDRFSIAEDQYIEDNIDPNGELGIQQSEEVLSSTGKKMAKGISQLEYLFLPIDEGDQATPIHKYVRKVYDDAMAKKETAHISRELSNMQKEVEAELKKLGQTNSDKFLLEGSTDIKYSLFFREDVHGNNRLISKHSLNWNKLTEGFNASLYNIDNEQDFSKKDQARRHVFNALKEAEVNFIDVRKIPEFISNPDLSEISGGFQDQATAENYKEELIQQLMRGGTNRSSAEREYKEIVTEQLNKLHEFQSEVESRLEKLLKKEEVGHVSELSDKSKMLYEQFIKTNSPFSFNESYENKKDSEIEVRYENKSGVIVTGKSPSTMNYTSFLPTTENFYSDTYKNKIENNNILYKYWETSSNAISYINRNRKYQKETEELERDEDGKIIRKYNPQQDYDDSLFYEYEISKEHSTFILNMGKYAPRAVWDRLKTTLSTARYRDTSGNMKIKGEIKSIDDVVKSGMKDMSRVLKAHNISLTKELEIKKVPAEALAYLEKRYGEEIPTDGTVNSIVKRISEREVLKSQKVNLTDSLISQLGAVETFKNKKEAEMQLLFAKNMFTKLNKSKSVDETSNGAKQISNFINYHLYGVNNRANWNTGKQGDVGASITSLQRKNLVDYTNSSIPLIQKAIEEINNNPLLNDSEKLNEAVRLDKLLEDAKSFTETGGRVITTGSIFEAVFLKLGILAGLGLNLKSQVHNILIGDLAGRQNDGEQWKEGNYADAVSYTRRWKRAGMRVMKNFGVETKMMKNQRLTKTLLNDVGIFQNSANEINNIAEENIGKEGLNLLTAPLTIIGEVEKEIQTKQILAMMGDTDIVSIKDNNGVEHKVFDGKNKSNPHPAFELVEGVLKLRPEFQNEHNQETWIDKTSQEYADIFGESGVIPRKIALINGDYRGTSTVGAKTTFTGSLLMMFKTWMPAHIMRRIGKRQGIMHHLKEGDRGTEAATATISSQAMNMLGNASIIGGPLAGMVAAVAYYGAHRYKREMIEDVSRTKAILKELGTLNNYFKVARTVGGGLAKAGQMTVNYTVGKNIIKNSSINKIVGMKQYEGETENEFEANQKRLHFLLTELGSSINTLVLKGLAQLLYHALTDDDEEVDKTAQMIHYGVENLLARYLEEINFATDPQQLLEAIVKGNASSSSEKLVHLTSALSDALEGDYTYSTGSNVGRNKVLVTGGKILIPKGIMDYGGFRSSVSKDYEPNDFFNKQQYSDFKTLTKKREAQVEVAKKKFEASVKKQFPYLNEERTKKKVDKKVKRNYPSISKRDFTEMGKRINNTRMKKYKRYMKE